MTIKVGINGFGRIGRMVFRAAARDFKDVAALTAAALALTHRRHVLAGSLLGLAFALKSTGLPLLILLAAQRRWRSLTAAGVVCGIPIALLLIWAGGRIWLRYPGYVWEFVQRPYVSVTAYQTTWGFVRHLCVGDPDWNPAAPASCESLATVLPGLVIASAILVTVFLSSRSRTELWVAAGISLSVIAVPIAEEHQFAMDGEVEDFAVATGAGADLGVTTGGTTVADWNQPFTFTVSVSNGGPNDVTGAAVAVAMSANSGAVTWTCVTTSGSCGMCSREVTAAGLPKAGTCCCACGPATRIMMM